MRKVIILIIVVISTYCLPAKSQAQDTLRIRGGIFFSPQGVISLQEPKKAFTSIYPVLIVTSFSKGNTIVNVMYNMTFNNFQAVIAHQISPAVSVYADGNKSILLRGGYAGLGVTRTVADGRAVGFVEVGSAWNRWSPALSIGAIIPLLFKIK